MCISWRWLLPLLCGIIELKRVGGFVNNPKIIAKDGNLIFESGLNRNISFHLAGTSRLIINDKWDLLTMLRRQTLTGDGNSDGYGEASDGGGGVSEQLMSLRELNTLLASIRTSVNGAQGIGPRMRLLQNSTMTGNQLIRRYRTRVNNLDSRVKRLTDRLEQDNCKANPCENGGTCYNLFNGFQCKCTKNFEGSKCDRDVNECALYAGTDLGCQNGGECVNQFGSYSCMCSAGWFGIHCTQRKDCAQSSAWELCGHGTCVSSSDTHGYRCICDQGWTTNGLTPACMVDVDECNGGETEQRPTCVTKCINLPGSFMCAPCPSGLTGNGLTCRDIDECATNNGGCSINPHVNCINTHGSYQCHECPIGWSGDGRMCTRDSDTSDDDQQTSGSGGVRKCSGHNICHPSARCLEISNTIVCSCPADMLGDGVGPYGCTPRKQLTCNDLPCLNGGTCTDKPDMKGYECSCAVGYNQPNCASTLDPCANRPCANNGVCRAVNNTMYQCHCMPGYSGQQCQTQVAASCGGLLSGGTGQLKYPAASANDKYEHNSQCAWVIRTTAAQVLNVTFDTFELEDGSECRADWLQINDGRTAAAQVLGRFCGAHKPMGGNIISSTNNLYLWFRSDNSSAKAGFSLHWNSIQPQCGGTIPFTTHGTIASPGSPGNYPKNRDCHWKLQAPNNKRIKLTFFSLRIENHDSCNYDYIEITDVISNELIAKYCKSLHPEPLLLSTNEVDIHFHSDGEDTDTGFQIYYSTESRTPGCGGIYTTSEGNIRSPDGALDSSVSCEYDIKIATGSSIRIDFVTLELNSPKDCIEFYDMDDSRNINALQVKYCGDYNIKPTKLNSLYNALRIIYYGKASKFELNYRTDCSYSYENDNGIITSPNYPQNLTPMERSCTYTIRTNPGSIISLHFVDFEIKSNSSSDFNIKPNNSFDDFLRSLRENYIVTIRPGNYDGCIFNALQITDEFEQFVRGPYCSDQLPSIDLISKTNSLKLHFKTSAMDNIGRGFKIEYKAIPMGENDCGGVYTEPSGSIKLPTNDNGNYRHDLICYWIIKAPSNKRISLNWKSFMLEATGSCYYDHVEIYDNFDNINNKKPLARYCGDKLPPALMTHSNLLYLKFESDSSDTAEGFELTYEFVDYNTQCGGNILSSNGMLTTPHYPLNYTNGLDCIWTVTAPQGTQIELQIVIFELEAANKCANDWLEVRNGGSEQSHVVGTFCGTQIPHIIPSFTNQMRLHFHSDNFVSARGFKIHWYIFSNNCGGNLAGNQGIITSPNYPNAYPENAQCEWLIQVKKGSAIQITIEDMAMETLFGCSYDRLQIYEGRHTDKLQLELCDLPNEQPHTITIPSHTALVRFESDSSNTDKGFLLSYKALCTMNITEMFGVIESPNYNDPFYKDDINCTWTVIAPKGNRVMLELTYFNSNSSDAGIYLVEKPNNVHVIRNIQTFNSSTNTIIIRQNTSSVSFQLEYQMYGCIQWLVRDSGEFQSPNYPNTYPNDIECLWIITTRLGRGIELTVSNIDIEEAVNCTNDALIISNTQTSHNIKERHCGKHNTDIIITTSSHQLFVLFQSNSQKNGKGFLAKYRTSESKCGGILKSRNGVIVSPNYPTHYPANSDCEWIITVSEGHTMILSLEELELEDFYDCELDSVQAFEVDVPNNGTDNDDDVDDNGITNERNIFKMCGELGDGQLNQWSTSTNTAIIRFHSDDSHEHKGFKLTYQERCGQKLSVDNEDFGEINFIRTAGENQTCVWEISNTDKSKRLMLKITHISLTVEASLLLSDEDCIKNGVQIIDGTDIKGPVSYKFCRHHPPDIISKGHTLKVVVPLSTISEFSAFYYPMDAWCGGEYAAMQGKFSTPFYPESYPADIDCEWYLKASAGNSYVLTFETMSIEESEDCNNDYVEIRETDSRGRLLGLFCGSAKSLPQPIVAHEMWIKFSSENDAVVNQGFIASYNYAAHNELNGTDGLIESPHYPTEFQSNQKYTWRISVEREFVIMLTIIHIIDIDKPHIKIYDGYVNIGTPSIDYRNSAIIRSHTSYLYITATRGPFQFEWKTMSKDALNSNETAERMVQQCGAEVLVVDNLISIQSPGYPNGYDNNLNCSYSIVPKDPTSHVVLSFTNIDLESFQECSADYVRILSSSDMQNWKQLDKLCKKLNTTVQNYHGTPYLKLEFITDSSLNFTGYHGNVRTECGSEISARNGFVNASAWINRGIWSRINCIWRIRGRVGRRIRISLKDMVLQNSNDNCRNYLIVRNGMSEDSPFLGRGKFCNDNATDMLDTSSNWAYIKFVKGSAALLRLAFHFEEIQHECSDEIQLSMDTVADRMKTIKSPNFPNLPNPHSECIWRITAPMHKDIAISFIGSFEMADEPNCNHEYIQINDGATELMPILGRYCGTKNPDTQYSSSNVLRVKYFTDLSEPHKGFIANVSIGQCGGLYFQTEGTIESPTQLNLRKDEKNFECVYTIEMPVGHTINLTIDKFDLPYSSNCSTVTHLELQEINRSGDEEFVSDTLRLCGDTENENRRYIVETNKLVVRYKIVDELKPTHIFRISYLTIGDRCGQEIIASRGTLQSPNYPDGIRRLTHCLWHLTVPRGRRVKVEFLDFDLGATTNLTTRLYSRIVLLNDFNMQSVISRISQMPSEPLYSTDNTMAIDAFLLPLNRHRGFRLRFSSDEENTKCRQTIINSSLIRYQSDGDNSTLYCRYNANVPHQRTLVVHVLKFEHGILPASMLLGQFCHMLSPLKLQLETDEWLEPHLLCRNESSPTLRLPFPAMIVLNANTRNKLQLLEFDYKVHRCGGLFSLSAENELNITQPTIPDLIQNANNTVECAWLVSYALETTQLSYDDFQMDGIQLELSLKMDLKGNCEEQYLEVYNGPNQNAPILGRYCGQTTANNLVVERGVFFEYYAASYELKSTFTVGIRHGSGCGGTLMYPYRQILFDVLYDNNVECVWDIVTDSGFYISLTFVDRFFIESSPNCTKDYILVQELTDVTSNEWHDLKRICGREAPQFINTTTTRMRFTFRSDNETRGDGFIAQFSRMCGGTYYANDVEQYLTSPGYPVAYPSNLTCEYEFLPAHNSADNVGIIVRFLDFDLESTPFQLCPFDNVTVKTWDNGDNSPSGTVLCGMKKPPEYHAKKRVSIVLRTDDMHAMRGFKLSYSTNLCGGNVTNTSLIQSPRHHLSGKYPNSSKCYWNITAPEGYKIHMKFEQIDFESLANCAYDGIEIYNGLQMKEAQRLGKFCGNFTGHKLPEFSISSNTALLYSFSDDRDASVGFKVLVVFKLNCDQQIFLGTHNESFQLDAYARGYSNNLDCEHVFRTEPGRQLLLHFHKFHVEESDGCHNDFVDLHDGAGAFAEQITHLCGHEMPSTEILSSRNAIYLRFVTDETETSGGFNITITSVSQMCGRHNMELKAGENIVLKAPMNTNGKYLKNVNCFWSIKSNHSIQLKFDQFDIEGPDANGSCTHDYLKIFSADNLGELNSGYGSTMIRTGHMDVYNMPYSTNVMYVYCGNERPSNQYFSSNLVYIKFVTNDEIEGAGFSLSASAVTDSFRNYTDLQGRILLSNGIHNWDIYITVPANYSLTLYYAKLNFFDFGCDNEFLEVFNAYTNNTLQKNCGYINTAKNLFTNSSSLRLNLKTRDYSEVDITYLASLDGPGCGGKIYNSRGIIASPFYPDNKRENSNCRWHIRVPKNLYVLLQFDEFNMGAKTYCPSDYLQIIEHTPSGDDQVVRQFCGEDQPKIYKSSSNYVTIYFHKTVNFDGTGWIINYSGVHPEVDVTDNFIPYFH